MGGRKDLCGARIGTSFEAKRWLSLDLCGFLGISMSFSAHAFAFTVIAWHLIAGSLVATAVFLLLYIPSVILALSSLFMAWTTNPGAVPLGARPLVTVKRAASGEMVPAEGRRNRALRRCHKCNDNFKPNRAHHDSVTGRCIVKFDHFCPWVGNAVVRKSTWGISLVLSSLYPRMSLAVALVFLILPSDLAVFPCDTRGQ
jgi:DHHC palmitoyltransferase